jgi:hypothetical protein
MTYNKTVKRISYLVKREKNGLGMTLPLDAPVTSMPDLFNEIRFTRYASRLLLKRGCNE